MTDGEHEEGEGYDQTAGTWPLVSKAVVEIEGKDLVGKLRNDFPSGPQSAEDEKRLGRAWEDFLKTTRIHIGTLLKTDSVSFLFGAGVSKAAGGVLLGQIPKEIEQDILLRGSTKVQVRAWVKAFYLAVARVAQTATTVPLATKDILERKGKLNEGAALAVNLESVLSALHAWRTVIAAKNERLQVDGLPTIDVYGGDLEQCIEKVQEVLAKRCALPIAGAEGALDPFVQFLKKVLTRPLNLKRVNIFTLNYDTLVEQAADAEGVTVVDGFVGTIRRVLRPESYDQDLYFPADTTEGRVHRLDRVVHLYKLHGSINWRSEEPDWANPYGIVVSNERVPSGGALIYPTPLKYGATLGMPYAELFRRFATAVVRPQSTLIVVGCSLGDEHVSAIVRQALAIPSFTLILVDPVLPAGDPGGTLVARLRFQKDRRVWFISGVSFATFDSFVKLLLPDLRDEFIMLKVMETHRALGGGDKSDGGET